jgi:hypothetical protein
MLVPVHVTPTEELTPQTMKDIKLRIKVAGIRLHIVVTI